MIDLMLAKDLTPDVLVVQRRNGRVVSLRPIMYVKPATGRKGMLEIWYRGSMYRDSLVSGDEFVEVYRQ